MAPHWQQKGSLWLLTPQRSTAQPPGGLIEFIGGSYLAATPQLSYRRLLEALAAAGWRIHAWSYVPGLDHQSQANDAWRCFRAARPAAGNATPILRLGHSLGCKLHLLAPDGGRGCQGLVALSFNNFSAERSIPLLANMGAQFGFRSEFSPSPDQTLSQVAKNYRQPRNLLVRFNRDNLDESTLLYGVLQNRGDDRSDIHEMPGDHLTPASAGLRQSLFGEWKIDAERQTRIRQLAKKIEAWGGTHSLQRSQA